ncbi:hypothetical protein [Nocardia sp. MW-W600-9]
MTTDIPSSRARTILAFTALGLVCGLAAMGLFQWWASGVDIFVVYGGSYEPWSPASGSVDAEPIGSFGDETVRLRIGLVAVPTVIGLLAGLVLAWAGWRGVRTAAAGSGDTPSSR